MTPKNPIEQDEYRVDKWDGKVEDGRFGIQHDSTDQEIVLDVEELHDLSNLVMILQMKDDILRGETENIGTFNRIVDDLEA